MAFQKEAQTTFSGHAHSRHSDFNTKHADRVNAQATSLMENIAMKEYYLIIVTIKILSIRPVFANEGHTTLTAV